MPKIHVLTVKLTCDIPVDPADPTSLQLAASCARGLLKAASRWSPRMESLVHRVPAPEPQPEPEATEPANDGLDTPDNLRRGVIRTTAE